MRKGYKIGLFFVCIMIVALMAALVWKRSTADDGSDGEGKFSGDIGEEQISAKNPEAETGLEEPDMQDVQAQSVDIVTTCDTICIYENIDKKDGAVSTQQEKLPAKYIGLTREQLEEALLEDGRASTLEDKQTGFQSQHLELFSPEKIKILRIYDTSTEQTGFYIIEIDGEIGVYRQDRTTLYFRTGLDPDALPEDVLNDVRNGKFMETELQVYHFLESYSS
ncbi:MAG: hypothetical protein LUE96_00135 [Lachnospiraceae bacterium]|nr:hypothetical protein [Lachnospiraceae bacterium]